jgi:hypothetical protein
MSDCVYPCPCGYANDPQKACTCAPAVVAKYQKRISGLLLDRIDIHIEVPRVDYEKLSSDRIGENRAILLKRDIEPRLEQCMHIRSSAIEGDRFCIGTHGLSNVSHHLMGDPAVNSSMMLDEVMLTTDIFQSRRTVPLEVRC